jgi:hypothetical protein
VDTVSCGLENIEKEIDKNAFLASADTPTFSDITHSPEHTQWKVAMQEEEESFKGHGVYKIVAKLEGEKILSTQWVFTQKRDEEGEVKRWKARIVARGYRQREDIDYDELLSPTVRFETIRTLLATVVGKNEPL